MSRRRRAALATLSALVLVTAACSGGDGGSGDTTTPAATDGAGPTTSTPVTTPATSSTATIDGTIDGTIDAGPTTAVIADGPWQVDTAVCADPAAATAAIGSIVDVGSVMPLFNSNAAPAFAPVKDGLQAYIQYARQNGMFHGYDDINLTIEDDKYDPSLTQGAVDKQIAAGADVFTGIIGTQNNEAVRSSLNMQCIPQLNALTGSPAWGDVTNFPWTTGLLVPYTVETQVYAAQMAQLFPQGATVGVFYVNNDFGRSYAEAIGGIAPGFGLDLVAAQTVEEADTESPTLQVAAIADATPDAILAVPLGAGCISFLTELATARLQHAGWNPAVFISSTCASNLIMAAAGTAADQVYSSDNLLDLTDATVQAQPAAQPYVAFMTGLGQAASVPSASVGWTAGEVTVAILNQAAASPAGLTRASIIDAARDFTLTPSLARPGVVMTSRGLNDPFLAQSLQVLRYDAVKGAFVDVGQVVTQFET